MNIFIFASILERGDRREVFYFWVPIFLYIVQTMTIRARYVHMYIREG